MYVMPEVLEQLPRLREVHDRLAESPRQLEGRLADDRHASDQVVVGRLARSPGRREFDRREVFRQRADRRADRHLVVVEHDQHLRLALADVVQRLEAEPAHQGGIADDHRDALVAAAQVAGRRKPLRDGEARAGVSAVENVVLRTRSAAESRRCRSAAGDSRTARTGPSAACAGRPDARCPRRCGRAANRAGGAARSSVRRRPTTSRGGRRCGPPFR